MSSGDDNEFCQRIRAAVAANRPEDLESVVSQVARFSFKHPTDDGVEFSDNIFRCIVEVMMTTDFQRMMGADALLVLFEYDWSTVTVRQRATLRGTIEAAYGHFTDSNACFVLAELLGEYFCDRDAFYSLVRLGSLKADHARALTVHGLRRLMENTPDTWLQAQCAARIKELAEDQCATVRQEAIEVVRGVRGG